MMIYKDNSGVRQNHNGPRALEKKKRKKHHVLKMKHRLTPSYITHHFRTTQTLRKMEHKYSQDGTKHYSERNDK